MSSQVEREASDVRMERSRRRHWKTVPVTVVLPDCSAYFMELHEDCRGHDCLAKMCEVLGIVEMDYFGLKFSDRLAGCEAWINNRVNLKHQLKYSRRPYRLGLRVKFFTDIHLLQQPSTKQAFFMDLRYRVQKGTLSLPNDIKPLVGALTAQVEMGNYQETRPRAPSLVYPEYFPDWNDGIAYHISKEHKKLIGMTKEAAIQRYLERVCDLEICGVRYQGVFEDQQVAVNIGSQHVHIINSEHRNLKRIPYYAMTQVSFGSTFFGLQYHSRNDEGTSVDKRLRVTVRNKYIARHIFRDATEQQVFFFQSTVLPEVRNHADNHSRRIRRLCKRVLCRPEGDSEYYFDVVRTKHEAYSHVWQLLHQVGGEREGEAREREGEEGTGADGAYATVTIESDDSSSQVDAADSDKLYWGLSTSSCNLAMDLLAEPHLQPSDSDTPLIPHSTSPSSHPPSPSSSFHHHTSTKSVILSNSRSSNQPRLNHTQSKKLRQLLLNIQDERLCQVCMNSKISAVFCPCGHHVACYRCARRLVKCPICRQPIGYVQYVYAH